MICRNEIDLRLYRSLEVETMWTHFILYCVVYGVDFGQPIYSLFQVIYAGYSIYKTS